MIWLDCWLTGWKLSILLLMPTSQAMPSRMFLPSAVFQWWYHGNPFESHKVSEGEITMADWIRSQKVWGVIIWASHLQKVLPLGFQPQEAWTMCTTNINITEVFDSTAPTTEVRMLGHHHHNSTPGWTHLISERACTQRSGGFTANHIRSPDAANHVEVKRSLYRLYLCCPSHHVPVSLTIIQHQSSHLSAIVSLTPYTGTAQHWIFNVDEICRFAFDS